MALFRSSDGEPLDEQLASSLMNTDPGARRRLVKYQPAILSALNANGEAPITTVHTHDDAAFVVVGSASVYEFTKSLRYGQRIRLPLDGIADVGVFGDEHNTYVKYLKVESYASQQYDKRDQRRMGHLIWAKMASEYALATASIVEENAEPRARELRARYGTLVKPTSSHHEEGVLRLHTGGPLELTRAIAVRWRDGTARDPEELYRGNPNFRDETMADEEEAKTFKVFDDHVKSLTGQGWRLVGIKGRNLHFQR